MWIFPGIKKKKSPVNTSAGRRGRQEVPVSDPPAPGGINNRGAQSF